MPNPYERHSRDRWEWGSPPGRSELKREAAEDDPVHAHTAGKKDKHLCKAAHWKGPHQPVLRVSLHPTKLTKRECKWNFSSWRGDEVSWWCFHDEVCAGCQKVLRTHLGDRECPDYHDITPEEHAACEAQKAEREERLAWWERQRKPVITGPQGYRRPKRKTPSQ
jgi:hypothetical protein